MQNKLSWVQKLRKFVSSIFCTPICFIYDGVQNFDSLQVLFTKYSVRNVDKAVLKRLQNNKQQTNAQRLLKDGCFDENVTCQGHVISCHPYCERLILPVLRCVVNEGRNTTQSPAKVKRLSAAIFNHRSSNYQSEPRRFTEDLITRVTDAVGSGAAFAAAFLRKIIVSGSHIFTGTPLKPDERFRNFLFLHRRASWPNWARLQVLNLMQALRRLKTVIVLSSR